MTMRALLRKVGALVLRCARCRRYTTDLEARARRFNTGRCGHCNGALMQTRTAPPRRRGRG